MPKAQIHGCAVLLIAEHCTPGSKEQSLSVGAWGQGVTQDSSFQVWVSNTGGHTVRCMYTSLPEKGTQIKPQQRLHVSVLHTWRASAKQFFPYYQKSTWNGKKKKKKTHEETACSCFKIHSSAIFPPDWLCFQVYFLTDCISQGNLISFTYSKSS